LERKQTASLSYGLFERYLSARTTFASLRLQAAVWYWSFQDIDIPGVPLLR